MRNRAMVVALGLVLGNLLTGAESFAAICRMSGRASNYQILTKGVARGSTELEQFENRCFGLGGHISTGPGLGCPEIGNLVYCYRDSSYEVFCTGSGSSRDSAYASAEAQCKRQLPQYPSGDCNTQSPYYSHFFPSYDCQE